MSEESLTQENGKQTDRKPHEGLKRKGGAQFPRVDLEKALDYSKRLVSKTFGGAMPADKVLQGVFDSASSTGEIRAAALKQYGLMKGQKSGYEATQLAKDLNTASGQDRTRLVRQACLMPPVFKDLYETFHGDKATEAQVRAQSQRLNVHPDNLTECTEVFLKSVVAADLATRSGGEIVFRSQASLIEVPTPDTLKNDEEENGANPVQDDTKLTGTHEPERSADNPLDSEARRPSANRAGVQISISVDGTLDADKLEKQLKLLRSYNII